MKPIASSLDAAQPLQFRIADFVFSLHLPSAACVEPFATKLAAFACDGPATMSVRWHAFAALPEPVDRSELLFDSGTYWRLARSGKSTRIALFDDENQRLPYSELVVAPDLSAIDILTSNDILSDAQHLATLFVYPLSELLLIIALATAGGVLVHACGLDDNGHGYLFAGNSGHGKSTTARLWQKQARLLNDDRIALRERDGEIWMYGTPWHGDVDEVAAAGVPLQQLFILAHGATNLATPLAPTTAAAQLISRAFVPLWDAAGMSNTLAFVERVVTRVPCARLEFVPGPGAVDCVRSYPIQPHL